MSNRELLPISELHQAARNCAEAGVPIFPVEVNGKKPVTSNGFYDATTDLRQIDEWWSQADYNLAMSPGQNNLFIIDIDPGANLTDLELPETYTVRTPHGLHKYFEGSGPTTASKIAPHVDTRGEGGYVLIPPSQIDGKKYEAVSEKPYASIPASLLTLLAQKETQKRVAASGIEEDTEINLTRAKDYLSKEKPAIEYQGSDEFTYKVGCRLKDLGISEDKAWDLMRELWLPRCEGEFTEDWVREKIVNAYSYGQNAPGADAIEPAGKVFAPLLATLTQQIKSKTLKPLTLSDLLARTPQPVQELVPGLIEKGIATFLSATGGSHKSRTALQWGLCVGTQTKVYGRVVMPATFIYLSYEDHADEVTRRAHAIAKKLALPGTGNIQYMDLTVSAPALVVVNETGLQLQPFWDELRDYLLSITGHKFLVIDSTYNALQFQGQAKINEASVKMAIELLNRLCAETDTTILALWHPSQAGQERGDASGWSVAWHNAPRARLSLTACRDMNGAYELRCEKRNNGPKGDPITLHWDNGVLLPDTELDSANRESRLMEACVEVALMAADSGQPITAQKNLAPWMLDEIEKRSSFRPANRRVKEELSNALRLQKLRYLKGSNKQAAGYYPFDIHEADRLARELRHKAEEQETKNV